MTMPLKIQESVVSSLRRPPQEMKARLRVELAVALYAQSILPFGKASGLAGYSRQRFAKLFGERAIPRHYTDQDLEYAGR